MNIANVTSRFALLSGLDNSEIYKWKTLIDDACDYVKSITIKENLDESETGKLEMLCAAYALKLYSLCNDENITSFTAGDVQIASPKSGESKGERLWKEYSEKYSELIDTKSFLFGRVI